MRTVKSKYFSQVAWQDLLYLNRLEIAYELLLSLPWLLASWFAASYGVYWAAVFCSFMFFLTGLRQVHNAYHYALGISRGATEWVMFVQSVLMLGSMHAIQVNHLRHHQYCMADEDIEAMSARMPWWRAVLVGPVFPWRLHLKAWAVGSVAQRRWLVVELFANLVWVTLVFFVFDVSWLKYHVVIMFVGQCWTSFFAVWTVHHDCENDEFMARTVRSRWKNWVTYSMFFHVEHHLFPLVPTCKLNQLAKRMDEVQPAVVYRQVI